MAGFIDTEVIDTVGTNKVDTEVIDTVTVLIMYYLVPSRCQ
jgi:hypothetical protein